MTVLIDGIGFSNRGAWLMLESVLDEVRNRMPTAVVAIPELVYQRNPDWCRSHGVEALHFPCGRKGRVRMLLARWHSRLLGRSLPLVPQDVDLLLDAAGFKYSDQFYERTSVQNREELDYYRSFTRKGRRIVLLPQAFGPFKKRLQQERLLSEWPLFDRVFVRDESSWKHLTGLVGHDSRMARAKDFTCLFNPQGKSEVADLRPVVIVPNKKMIEATEAHVSEKFLMFLKTVVAHLVERHLPVVLLNHGGRRDAEINEEIAAAYAGVVLVINNPTAIDCKQIIRDARLLLTSRFHGAVSGFVQRVPTLCTGWSHKYRELAGDFGLLDSLLDVTDISDALDRIDRVLSYPDEFIAPAECCETYCQGARTMWDSIFADFSKTGEGHR